MLLEKIMNKYFRKKPVKNMRKNAEYIIKKLKKDKGDDKIDVLNEDFIQAILYVLNNNAEYGVGRITFNSMYILNSINYMEKNWDKLKPTLQKLFDVDITWEYLSKDMTEYTLNKIIEYDFKYNKKIGLAI